MVTIKVDLTKYQEIKDYYSSFIIDSTGEYIDYAAKKDGVVITGYLSNKQKRSITFGGTTPESEAKKWSSDIETSKTNKIVQEHWVDLNDQIGSDEVGVGDFFGPMIVCASYVKAKDIQLLIDLGVHDSKKLTDEKIREIAPILASHIEYSKLTLSNDKYNEMIKKGENINSLKAKMHNRALANMVNEHPDVVGVYVDQFVNKEKFYQYLNDKNEKIIKDISFKTKGESYFPCVAAASVIARYSFLLEMDALNDKYKLDFPFGASSKVDEFGKAFIKKFGMSEFDKLVKKNFANYKKITEISLI